MILRERGDARELMANRQCRADIVGSVLHNVEQTERDKKQKSARVLDWLVASGTDPTSNDEVVYLICICCSVRCRGCLLTKREKHRHAKGLEELSQPTILFQPIQPWCKSLPPR
jgi:hypothetical protein